MTNARLRWPTQRSPVSAAILSDVPLSTVSIVPDSRISVSSSSLTSTNAARIPSGFTSDRTRMPVDAGFEFRLNDAGILLHTVS